MKTTKFFAVLITALLVSCSNQEADQVATSNVSAQEAADVQRIESQDITQGILMQWEGGKLELVWPESADAKSASFTGENPLVLNAIDLRNAVAEKSGANAESLHSLLAGIKSQQAVVLEPATIAKAVQELAAQGDTEGAAKWAEAYRGNLRTLAELDVPAGEVKHSNTTIANRNYEAAANASLQQYVRFSQLRKQEAAQAIVELEKY